MNQLSLFRPTQGASRIPSRCASHAQDFINGLRIFDAFGKLTVFQRIDGIPYFINEFWTSRQRQAHSIHEISYRACFKPELPAFFISRLTRPRDKVFDPFMGRGTTPIQAALMGRRPLGNDSNPLSVLLTRPRLSPVTSTQIAEALADVDWSKGTLSREDLLAFYHPETLKKLEALRLWIHERAPLDCADP